MAETTGTARQEAERLVATVLAMASQAGLGGAPKDRDPAGSPGLTDMITGLVGQFLGDAPGNPPPATPRQQRDSADNADGRSTSQHGAGQQGASQQGPGQHGASQHGASQQGPGQQGAGLHGSGQRSPGADRAAGRGHGRQGGAQQLWDVLGGLGGWSTGSAECCVCPICRAIAGVRDPSPEQAERLATGAGDFASGVASLLRAFSVVTGTTGGSTRRKPPARPTTTPDQAWSAATRSTNPRPSTPPDHEVREGDDPWTAATRAPRPQPPAETQPAKAQQAEAHPAEAPSAAAAAPPDGTTETAAAQAATQTDAAGLADAAAGTDAPGPAADVRRHGDPWAAATRAAGRPAPARRAGTAAAGGGTAQAATTADAQPPTDRAERTHREPVGGPAGAVEQSGARTERIEAGAGAVEAGETRSGGAGAARVTGATDVWAAATAATGDTAGDTGVADAPSVDHDVPGTAPAVSAAEGRCAGPGGAARAGDAV